MAPISRILIGEDDQHDLTGIFIPIRKKTPDQSKVAKKT